jgi:hypothetical protein
VHGPSPIHFLRDQSLAVEGLVGIPEGGVSLSLLSRRATLEGQAEESPIARIAAVGEYPRKTKHQFKASRTGPAKFDAMTLRALVTASQAQ